MSMLRAIPLNHGLSVVFRCDRAASEDLSRGGVMIACAPHMLPIPAHIQHHPSLEVVSVTGEATAALPQQIYPSVQ